MTGHNPEISSDGREQDRLTRRHFLKASAVGAAAVAATVTGVYQTRAADAANNRPAQPATKSKKMNRKAKITLVQLTDDGNPEDAVRRMGPFFHQAAEYGSDLIVFPEYVLGRKISITHPTVQKFLEMARQHKMYAIAGLVESHGDKWATTALMVDRSGNLLGRYLKCHPACGPAPYFWPPIDGNDSEARGILGNQFKVFHLDFGPVGILQCYDGYFPEAWGCTSYAGAEIILWINGRPGAIEDAFCIMPSHCYGCVVGATITNGKNTGFAASKELGWLEAPGERESGRLFPRIDKPGDGCVHATVNLDNLRKTRKHLRTMHQRRPDLYGLLTQDVKMWQNYPDIPWTCPEAAERVNKAQL
jgi:predicted amidohydrolase